ncbi:MAG: hypothetical protein IPL61_36900 [Myxococcales bacterium]|nr:hypothetical protein [Myxococcales bacterium]
MTRARRAVIALAVVVGACADDAAPPDAETGPWRRGPDLPAARLEPAVAARADRLVVVGGFGPGLTIERTVDELDPATGRWTSGPLVPVAWTHAQLVAVGPRLFLLGGLAGRGFEARGDVFVDDGAGWQPRAPLPIGAERGGAAVIASATTIYLLGGASTTAAVASAWAYDVAADRWDPLPDLPTPRSHPVAGLAPDGTVVVAGGLRTLDAAEPIADVLALAPGAAGWQPRAPMPTARGGCAAGVVDGELWCAGGEAGTSALATVEAYAFATDTWRTLPPLPAPRAGTQGAVIAGALYIPGGAAHLAYEPEASVFRWQP